MDGLVERLILAGVIGSAHPVGGQLDVRQLGDRRGGQIGDHLGHGQTRGRRRRDQRDRGTLAHRHRFTDMAVEGAGGDGAIGHRYLPRTDHLVARDHAGDRAVTDGDQEFLGGDGGQLQHTGHRFARVEVVETQRRQFQRLALEAA